MEEERISKLAFDDGSVYEISDIWLRALDWTYGLSDELFNRIKEQTEDFWNRKMRLTKYGECSWLSEKYDKKESFNTKAELCANIIYYSCRCAILALVMKEASGKSGKVIGLNENGSATIYDSSHAPEKK
jgi:hypothetical protein